MKTIIVNPMSSGEKHDKATIILCIPFSLVIGICLGLENSLIAGSSFIVNGLWLSPDLDVHSRSLKRWGVLKFLWWPYTKFIRHRSFLSHGPLIGSSLRISYLLCIAFLIKVLLSKVGVELELMSINQISSFIKQYPQQILAIILGAEASAWLHIIMDGDPLPLQWRKLKK